MNGFNFQLDTTQGVEVPKNANTVTILQAKIDSYILPNGEYVGYQSGYEIQFTANGVYYSGETKDGIRGINCKVTVVVNDGVIYVK